MGCAGAPQQTYSGPARPADEVAILRSSINASVLEIDGTPVTGFGGAWALLPGKHEILLRIQVLTDAPNMRWNAWSYCRLTLDAIAGENYVSRVRMRKEIAPGLAEKVELEAGVADASGALTAPVLQCSAKRPKRSR